MNAIVERINAVGCGFVEFALPMLIQASVLIVLLLLADLLLCKRVRAVLRYWIWMLVLVKLVLPTSLSGPFSVGYWFGDEIASVDVGRNTYEPQSTMSESPAPILPYLDVTNVAPAEYSPPAPSATEAEPLGVEAIAPPPVQIRWQGVAFLLWAAIAGALLLLLAQRAIFVRSLVVQSKDAGPAMCKVLDDCRKAMKVRRKPGLKISPNATSPAVCGMFRPVILVPSNLSAALGSEDLRVVLLHELAHIKRGDLWVNLAQTLLQIVYFYNPLLWPANAVIRKAREQAVDEAVLVAMGEKAGRYPETLVSVAKLAFERPMLSLRLIGVVESKSALTARIRRILSRPIPKSAKLGVCGLAAIVAIAAFILPMAQARPYTERAATAIKLAEGKARELNHAYVGTEHILLALAEQSDGVAAKILDKLGIDKDALQDELKRLVKGGAENVAKSRLRQTPRAKRVFEYARSEARALDHDYIGTEHIFLGLMQERNGVAAQMLANLGVSYDVMREEILGLVEPGPDAKGRSPFVARLTNGVTVELVGVCEHPSEGKQWWRADGSPLGEKPYGTIKGDKIFVGGDDRGSEFVVRLGGAGDVGIKWKTTPESSPYMMSFPHGKDGRPLADVRVLVTKFDKRIDRATIRIEAGPKSPGDDEVQDYQWAEFRNVSLSPGAKTGVQIEVEGMAGGNGGNENVAMPANGVTNGPELEFLSWDKSDRDNYWHVDGSVASDESELRILKNMSHPGCSDPEHPNYEWLKLAFSHPLFDEKSPIALRMIDDSGEHRKFVSVTAAAGRDPKTDLGNRGWVLRTVSLGTKEDFPEQCSFELDYAIGDWKTEIAEFAKDQNGIMTFGSGFLLGSIGQNSEGKTTIDYFHRKAKTSRQQHRFVAVTQDGIVLPSGHVHGGGPDMYKDEYEFDIPLEQIEHFQFQTRQVKTAGFQNVSLRPGVKPEEQKGISFGPVAEPDFSNLTDLWIDLDNNKTARPPESVARENTAEPVLKWFRANGIDGVVERTSRIRGLGCFDLLAVRLDKGAWSAFDAEELHEALGSGDNVEPVSEGGLQVVYLRGVGDLPATYGFRTREGGIGILQITGFDESSYATPKFRYKMINEMHGSKTHVEAERGEAINRNWASFRGPGGRGVSAFSNAPTDWDGASGKGILWKSAVPLAGNSSPVVWGDRIFVSGGKGDRLEVYCFDGSSGKLLWTGDVPMRKPGITEKFEPVKDTGLAASTMVTDGERVFAIFTSGDMGCFDFSGRRLWTKMLGIPDNVYGHASSLAIYRNLVIVQLDQGKAEDGKSKLIAFDTSSGSIVWEAKRPVRSSWASPIIAKIDATDALITCAEPWVIAYAPAGGNELWRAECLAGDLVASPIYSSGLTFVCEPYSKIVAIRTDGRGDVTKTHIAWSVDEPGPDICSPVSNGKFVLFLNSDGLALCFNAADGKKLWEEDIKEDFLPSPSLVGDKLYLLTEKGHMIIAEANPKYKELKRCKLGEKCHASPAFAGGKIFLRGEKNLYCIGGASEPVAKPIPVTLPDGIVDRPLSVGKQQYLDLDTGRYVSMEGRAANDIAASKAGGVDLYLTYESMTSGQPGPHVKAVGMAVRHMPHVRVPGPSAREAAAEALADTIARPGESKWLTGDSASGAWAFRTAEGRAGVLRIKWPPPGAPPQCNVEYALLPQLDISIEESKWGEEVGGLRAAVEFVPDKEAYVLGERADVRLHVRNVSEREVEFESISTRQDYAIVKDGEGKDVKVDKRWHSGTVSTRKHIIKPGEVLVLDTTGIGFGDVEDSALISPPKEPFYVGSIVHCKVGEYSISYPVNRSLVTGTRKVTIAERPPVDSRTFELSIEKQGMLEAINALSGKYRARICFEQSRSDFGQGRYMVAGDFFGSTIPELLDRLTEGSLYKWERFYRTYVVYPRQDSVLRYYVKTDISDSPLDSVARKILDQDSRTLDVWIDAVFNGNMRKRLWISRHYAMYALSSATETAGSNDVVWSLTRARGRSVLSFHKLGRAKMPAAADSNMRLSAYRSAIFQLLRSASSRTGQLSRIST